MRYKNVFIESMGYVLPQRVVSSEELEAGFSQTLARLGLPKGQIVSLSGVKERRWWEPGTKPSTVASMAGKMALEKADVDPKKLDALINTSVSRDYLEPATAALSAGQLGVSHDCMVLDVTNACLGFVNGLIVAANMIELGQIKDALVICGETPHDGIAKTVQKLAQPDATTKTFRDNFASLTLGCGAVAFYLTCEDRSTTGHRIKGGVYRTATEHNQLCIANDDFMHSDPAGLLTHGVGLAVETWPFAAKAFGWGRDSVDEYICHQVSLAHFKHTFSQLDLPIEKAILTFPFLGNVGPASLPLTLALGEAQGRIKNGQELGLFAVGSGLGCIIMAVEW